METALASADTLTLKRAFYGETQAALVLVFVRWRLRGYRLGNVPKHRAVILLVVATVGIGWFSSGISLVDTVALLACGLMAGGSLAALAAARQKTR